MSEDSMLKCLIAFILGWLLCRMMGNGNGFSVGGPDEPHWERPPQQLNFSCPAGGGHPPYIGKGDACRYTGECAGECDHSCKTEDIALGRSDWGMCRKPLATNHHHRHHRRRGQGE